MHKVCLHHHLAQVLWVDGEFYYVGYNGFGPNENLGFTNYFYPSEHAQRFTIGVRHANPSYGMDHADLDRYMIRVERFRW